MELKDKGQALLDRGSPENLRIHSMELKGHKSHWPPARTAYNRNPFNGIESAEIVTEADRGEIPGIHSMELKVGAPHR